MTNFIQKLITRLNALKSGITLNAAKWLNQPVTTVIITDAVQDLTDKDNEIETAKDALSTTRSQGRTLANTHEGLADQTENLALGIHQSTPEKLVEYNISQRKTPVPKNPPGMAVIASLKDDSDGIGFVITTQALADAETFDIERAVTEADVMTATDFSHIKTTQKLTYIDDDVITGKRHHYRVRASNRKGSGPVSASMSAIQ
ncbi:MAG TPA: hypothetical protein VI757_12035 [Bacteroidia bacterium]|nr:hypothetical protein [Bacteroidia bacterium]